MAAGVAVVLNGGPLAEGTEAEMLRLRPVEQARFFTLPVESLDARNLTVAVGVPSRGVPISGGALAHDEEREAAFRDTMVRAGVDLGVSLLTLDPVGAVLAVAGGVVSYLGYQASQAPGHLNELGGVYVLTLTGPDFLPGLGPRNAQTDAEENGFFSSFRFDYDPLAFLLTDLQHNLGQPIVYEVDRFQLGSAVAVLDDDRVVASAPGLRFNFWEPPSVEGGPFAALFGSRTAYPYPRGLYGAYDTEALQALVGQMRGAGNLNMVETVAAARAELAEQVTGNAGVDWAEALQGVDDAFRAKAVLTAGSQRLDQLYEVGMAARQSPTPRPSVAAAQNVASQFRGSLSRLRAAQALNTLERAFQVVSFVNLAFDAADLLLGGGVTTPRRMDGVSHPTGMQDTLTFTNHLEWAGFDPMLHWQRLLEADWIGNPSDLPVARTWESRHWGNSVFGQAVSAFGQAVSVTDRQGGHQMAFADPRQPGHRSRSGYSLAVRGGVMAAVSNFEGSRGLSVLDLYRFDEVAGQWVPMPAIKEDLVEGIDTIRAAVDRQAFFFSKYSEEMAWPKRAPGADFLGEAKQTVILGDDVFILRGEGGLLWFPERLRPERDTFMTRPGGHRLAQNAFYQGLAHGAGLGARSFSHPRVAAPPVMRQAEEAFREGRFPIALADWDGSLGGSLAVAAAPHPDVPALAFGIPKARGGRGLLAVMAPTHVIEGDDLRIGPGGRFNGHVLEPAEGETGGAILLPPRIRAGGYFGHTGERHRQPHFGMQMVEVPESVGTVTGLGRSVAMTAQMLVASDDQNRLHLWRFDGRPGGTGTFVYMRDFAPAYDPEGRTVRERARKLAFAGESTLVGTDVMTDDAHAVWAVDLALEAEIRLKVLAAAELFPEEGIPVLVEESGSQRFGGSAFRRGGDAATVEARVRLPATAVGARELRMELRLFASDPEDTVGAPTEPFGGGTLRLYRDAPDGRVLLGEARRLSESWRSPAGFHEHFSTWRLAVDPREIADAPLIVSYAAGIPEEGNHAEILDLILETDEPADATRLDLAWTRAVPNSVQFAREPGETLVWRLPAGRRYTLRPGESYLSDAPRHLAPWPGDSLAAEIRITGFDGRISGVVVTPANRRLAGIPLALTRGGEIISETSTGDDGGFILPGAVPGGQEVVSLLDGPFFLEDATSLPPGEVTLVLRSEFAFTETLSRSNGEPVADAAVHMTDWRTGETIQTRTDENGRFTFAGIFPGFFVFQAATPIRTTELGTLSAQVSDGALVSSQSDFTFTFPVFEASVELVDASTGERVPLAEDTFSFRSFLLDWRDQTAEFPGELNFGGGRAYLRDLDRRSSWLAELDPGEDWFLPGEPLNPGRLPGGGFTIAEGPNVFGAIPMRTLTGQISRGWETGGSLQGLRLLLSGQPTGLGEERHFIAALDAGGGFTLRVPEGVYTLGIEPGFVLTGSPHEIVVGPDGVALEPVEARLDPNNILTGRFLTGVAALAQVGLEWEGGSMTLEVGADGRFASPPLDPRPRYTQSIRADHQDVEVNTGGWRPHRIDGQTGERVPLETGALSDDPVIWLRDLNFKVGDTVRWSLLVDDPSTGRRFVPPAWYLRSMGIPHAGSWTRAFEEAEARATLTPNDWFTRFQYTSQAADRYVLREDTQVRLRLRAPPVSVSENHPPGAPGGSPVATLDLPGLPPDSWMLESVLDPGGQPSADFGAGGGGSIVALRSFPGWPVNSPFEITARLRLDDAEGTLIDFPLTVRVNHDPAPFHLGIADAAAPGFFSDRAERNPYEARDSLRLPEQYAGDPLLGVFAHIVPGLEVRDPAPTLEILDPALPFAVGAYDPEKGTFPLAATALLDHEESAQHFIPLRLTDANGASLERTLRLDIDNLFDPVRATFGEPLYFEEEEEDRFGMKRRWFDLEVSGIILEDPYPQTLSALPVLETGTLATAHHHQMVRSISLLPHPSGAPDRRLVRIELTDLASGTHSFRLELRNRAAAHSPAAVLPGRDDFHERLPTVDLTLPIGAAAPRWVHQPPPRVRTMAGGRLDLHAAVIGGTPPVVHQWLLDGTPVEGAHSPTLSIPVARPEHAGTWRLRVTNPGGELLSEPVEVSMDLPGDLIVWGPDTVSSPQPVRVPQSLTEVVAAATSLDGIGVALQADGGLATFRAFDDATAPDFWNATGNANQQIIRARLEALEALPEMSRRVVALAAGSHHFLGLTDTGTVRAWGENEAGQRAVPPGLPAAHAIRALGGTSGALLMEGGLRLWGAHADGFQADFSEHDTVFTDLSFATTAAGFQVLALRADGSLFAWPVDGPAAQLPELETRAVQVWQTPFASYAVLADGSLARWGETQFIEPMPALPPVRDLQRRGGRLFATGLSGEMVAWMEWHTGDHAWMPSFDWAPPGLGAGESFQAPLAAGITLRQAGILQPRPPALALDLPGSVEVPLGTTLRLEVAAAPTVLPLTYLWTFDGVPIAGATGPFLRIDDFQTEMAGHYQVVVSGEFGALESAIASVGVVLPPAWTAALPGSAEVARGAPLLLESPAQSTAPVTYEWRLEGALIAAASTLSIPQAGVADAGTYTVTARNRAGSISRQVVVEVLEEPRILPTAPWIGAAPGQTVVLRVAVDERLPTDYQWFLGGVPVPGGQSPVLTLGDVSAASAGTYRLIASNSVGTSEVEVELAVADGGFLVGWGQGLEAPPGLRLPAPLRARTDIMAVAVATGHGVALDATGSLHPWGAGAIEPPVAPPGDRFVDVAAGAGFTAALTRAGQVVVSPGGPLPPVGLGPVARVAAGDDFLLALGIDGVAHLWGNASAAPAGLAEVTAIAAAGRHAHALRSDGTVLRWRVDQPGEAATLTSGDPADPIVGVAAGEAEPAFLLASGAVVYPPMAGAVVPSGVPARFIAAGDGHISLLNAEGRFAKFGSDGLIRPVPQGLPEGIGLASAGAATVAIVRADQGPLFRDAGLSQYTQPGSTVVFTPHFDSVEPPTFQWFLNGDPLPGADLPTLTLSGVDASDAGVYRLHATAGGATSVSRAYILNVAPGGAQALRPSEIIQTRGPVTSLSRDGDLLAVAEEAGLFYVNLRDPFAYYPFINNYFAFKPYSRAEYAPDPADGGLAAGTPPWGLDASEEVEVSWWLLDFEIELPQAGVEWAIEAFTDSLGRLVVPLQSEIHFDAFPAGPDEPNLRVLYQWSRTWPSASDDWTLGGIIDADKPNALAYIVPASPETNLAGIYTFRLQVRFQELSPNGSVWSETVKWREVNLRFINGDADPVPAVFELKRPGGKGVTGIASGNNAWVSGAGASIAQPVALITDREDPHTVSWVRYPAGFPQEAQFFPAGGDLQTPAPVRGKAALGHTAYLATAVELAAVGIPASSSGAWDFAASRTWSLPLPAELEQSVDLVVHEGFLYAPLGAGGLHIFDLSNPAQPRLVALLDDLPAFRATVAHGRAFVATGHAIRILDIADPANPQEISRMTAGTSALAASADALYSIIGNTVVFYDISDPANPRQTGAFNYYDWLEFQPTFAFPRRTFFFPFSLEIWEDRLIVGTQEHGLFFFDLKAPPALEAEVEVVVAPNLTGRYLVPEVSGSLPMTYAWHRNGELLENAPNEEWLHLPALDGSTAGVYELIATNPFGSVRSEPIIIQDPRPPVDFTWLPGIHPTRLFHFGDAIIGVAWSTGHFIQLTADGVPRHTGNGNVMFGPGAQSPVSDGQHLFLGAQNIGIYDGTWLWQYGTTASQILPVTQRKMPEDPNAQKYAEPGVILAISPDKRYLAVALSYPHPFPGDPSRVSRLQIYDLANGGVATDPVHEIILPAPEVLAFDWLDDATMAFAFGFRGQDFREEALALVALGADAPVVSALHTLPPTPNDWVYQLIALAPDRVLLSLTGKLTAYDVDRSGPSPIWSPAWERVYDVPSAGSHVAYLRPDSLNPGQMIGYNLSWSNYTYLRLDLAEPEDPVVQFGPFRPRWIRDDLWLDSITLGPPHNMVYRSDLVRGFGYLPLDAPRGNPVPQPLSASGTVLAGQTGAAAFSGEAPMAPLGEPATTAALGRPYRFNLSVEGADEFTFHYAWFRDGGRIAVTYSPSLTLESLSLADVGEYSVTVTGTGGSVSFPLPAISAALVLGVPTHAVAVPEFTTFADDWSRGTGATFSLAGEVPETFQLHPHGEVVWTPGEIEGGHTWTPDLIVTFNGRMWSDPLILTAIEVNHPPVSLRGPVPPARPNRLWSYDLRPFDSDIPAQTITSTLLEGPAGMALSASSGVLVWQVPADAWETPLRTVRVRLHDGVDGTEETFTLEIVPANTPPRWTDQPTVFTVAQGGSLSHQLRAVDDDLPPQPLTYSLVGGPPGLTIAPSGLLTWDPVPSDFPTGAHTALARVSDGISATDGAFRVDVLPAPNTFAALRQQALIDHFAANPGTLPDEAAMLLRFASGLDLLAPIHDRLPTAFAEPAPAGGTVLGLTFTRRSGGLLRENLDYAVDGIRYRVEVSRDLITWLHGPDHLEPATPPTPGPDGTETVEIRARAPSHPSHPLFIRLAIFPDP